MHARLDEFSVAEIQIYPQGDRRIVIELPDVKNPEQAKARIGKTAMLEMKTVIDYALSEQDLLDKYGGTIPSDMMMVHDKPSRRATETWYLVSNHADVTGKLLKEAKAEITEGDFGIQHCVRIVFNAEGADKFYELTKKSIGKPVAILVDNIVISAPFVEKPISGGNAVITFGEQS